MGRLVSNSAFGAVQGNLRDVLKCTATLEESTQCDQSPTAMFSPCFRAVDFCVEKSLSVCVTQFSSGQQHEAISETLLLLSSVKPLQHRGRASAPSNLTQALNVR